LHEYRGKLKKVDTTFLEAHCQHFQEVGHGIFQKMYDQYPTKYFEGLIALAKAGMPLHVKHAYTGGPSPSQRYCRDGKGNLSYRPRPWHRPNHRSRRLHFR
jgi:hypothetical protein